MQKVLFITKTRSGFGSHIVLTQLVHGLRKRNTKVDVLVSEHATEHSRWPKTLDIWDDIKPEVLTFSEHISEQFKVGTPDAFSNYDDVLLNDTNIVNRIKRALESQTYTYVVLDSWYITYAAIMAGASNFSNVVQLVQSEPEFVPENREKQWKAAAFKLLAHMPLKRIFISKTLSKQYEITYGQAHPYTSFFLEDTFQSKDYAVDDTVDRPLRLVSVASNFNLPNKGLKNLLQNLSIVNAQYFPVELSLICAFKINMNLSTDYPVSVITDALEPIKRAVHLMNSDLYVTTTRNESPGLAQAEAIALGMPSVALDSNGNHDYYNGKNFLMAKNNTEFIKYIVACNDVTVRKTLSREAISSMQHFTLDNFIQRFLDILTKN